MGLFYICSVRGRAGDIRRRRAARHEGDFVIHDFRFHTGEPLPELKQHYVTLGDPKNPAVLVLHGTSGTGAGLLNAGFGGELFGPGQPLDAAHHFIILPDSIGAGKSSKPSDGLQMKFPRYTYEDMIAAQYRLLTEHLGVRHLELVTGNSMGGMLTWMWGEAYPDFMDDLVPLASQPSAMAARNWMMRRLMIETIKADPAFQGGNYTSQPPSLKYANAMFSAATSGGTLGWQARAGTHAEADRAVDEHAGRAARRRRQRHHLSVRRLARLRSRAGAGAHQGAGAGRSTPPMTSAIRPRPE